MARIALVTSDATLMEQATTVLRDAGMTAVQVDDPAEIAPATAGVEVLVVDEEAADAHQQALQTAIRRKPAILLQSSRDARCTCRALREGYRECLLIPEDLSMLPDAIARWREIPTETMVSALLGHEAAQVIACFSGSGGSGRTTITAHLAAAMARRGLRTLAVDLNLQLGTLRPVFGREGSTSLADLLPVLEELEAAHLQSAVDNLAPYLDLLAAPGTDMVLTDADVQRLIAAASRRYQVVVLDLPPVVSPATLGSFQAASTVLYILEPGGSHLWTLGALLSRLDEGVLPRERLQVIINHRSPHLVRLGGAEIRKLYSLPVLGEVPFDSQAPLAPVLQQPAAREWSGLPRAVDQLAEALLPNRGTPPAQHGSRRVSLHPITWLAGLKAPLSRIAGALGRRGAGAAGR